MFQPIMRGIVLIVALMGSTVAILAEDDRSSANFFYARLPLIERNKPHPDGEGI